MLQSMIFQWPELHHLVLLILKLVQNRLVAFAKTSQVIYYAIVLRNKYCYELYNQFYGDGLS